MGESLDIRRNQFQNPDSPVPIYVPLTINGGDPALRSFFISEPIKAKVHIRVTPFWPLSLHPAKGLAHKGILILYGDFLYVLIYLVQFFSPGEFSCARAFCPCDIGIWINCTLAFVVGRLNGKRILGEIGLLFFWWRSRAGTC